MRKMQSKTWNERCSGITTEILIGNLSEPNKIEVSSTARMRPPISQMDLPQTDAPLEFYQDGFTVAMTVELMIS